MEHFNDIYKEFTTKIVLFITKWISIEKNLKIYVTVLARIAFEW